MFVTVLHGLPPDRALVVFPDDCVLAVGEYEARRIGLSS